VAVGARDGKRAAKVRARAGRYTFTATKTGRWNITVAFAGARGWKSQKVSRTVQVP
jgi:hypothetical protein